MYNFDFKGAIIALFVIGIVVGAGLVLAVMLVL